MPYIGGTPEVQNFIKKYIASGYLVDPYSKEWLASLDARKKADKNFYCEIYNDRYSENEDLFGSEFWNHLLILRIDESNPELIKDLKAIYQPFKSIFEERDSMSGHDKHRPDFILINLNIRKILCIGLGRKNRLFDYDLDEYLGNVPSSVNFNEYASSFTRSNSYYQHFLSDDHAEIVLSLIQGLSDLGSGLFEKASTPGNPDEWPNEPNEDGMYLIEDGEYTAEKFEAIKDGYYQADELMREGFTSINLLFPEIEIGDLNTGDY